MGDLVAVTFSDNHSSFDAEGFPRNYVKNHDLLGEFWVNMEEKDKIPTIFGIF